MKTVLNLCGFNTFLSFTEITPSTIRTIEEFVSSQFATQIAQIDCCHAEYYKSQISRGQFKLLPGHEMLVLVLPKYIEKYQTAYMNQVIQLDGRYSFIMNEMLKTAEENKYKEIHGRTYPDSLRFFAVYQFLLSGRAAYKMFQSNLPLPSMPTIREL